MAIKLIAVDMDGTFLDSHKHYNRVRFMKIYQLLKQQNIRFVVASGNPMYTLHAYFAGLSDELSFVAENGAYVMSETQDLHYSSYAPEIRDSMVKDLVNDDFKGIILCAKSAAYVNQNLPERILERLRIYFKKLNLVEDLTQVKLPICKMTVTTPGRDTQEILAKLEDKAYMRSGQSHMVSSGFGFVDLIQPDQHKAYGLQVLAKHWDIKDHEMMAFGDNFNDIEMLEKVGYAVAMQNAVPELKQVADFIAPDHNQEGVLSVIEAVLAGELESFRHKALPSA